MFFQQLIWIEELNINEEYKEILRALLEQSRGVGTEAAIAAYSLNKVLDLDESDIPKRFEQFFEEHPEERG